ncbi:MAG TPA: ATP-binding cassette domain-containing protein, partial [Deltaproteobacteria bacterium]|nr:ATP-binding cassette domain-containing protein [Deltaproteobacteria bacterium]
MLRVREIDVYYGQLQALVQVSIDVDQGEVVSVIGSNGTGKSTTLKTISGILKPRRGTIEYKGQVISRRPP